MPSFGSFVVVVALSCCLLFVVVVLVFYVVVGWLFTVGFGSYPIVQYRNSFRMMHAAGGVVG